MVSVANCQLCEVVHYCAGSNGTKDGVHYMEYILGVFAVEGVRIY